MKNKYVIMLLIGFVHFIAHVFLSGMMYGPGGALPYVGQVLLHLCQLPLVAIYEALLHAELIPAETNLYLGVTVANSCVWGATVYFAVKALTKKPSAGWVKICFAVAMVALVFISILTTNNHRNWMHKERAEIAVKRRFFFNSQNDPEFGDISVRNIGPNEVVVTGTVQITSAENEKTEKRFECKSTKNEEGLWSSKITFENTSN